MSIKSGILMNTRVLDTFVQFKEFFFSFFLRALKLIMC